MKRIVAHLTDDQVSVVIASDGGMPEVLYWGAPLGPGAIEVAQFERPVVGGGLDDDTPVGVLPESARGWFGRPGIEGARLDGSAAATLMTTTTSTIADRSAVFELSDAVAAVGATVVFVLHPSSVLTVDVTIANRGDTAFNLAATRVTLPVGDEARELLTLVGRHTNEFVRHRASWERDLHSIENRHGKTSHERSGVAFAGPPGFSEQCGPVWGVHLGWSGNYELTCDASTDGRRLMAAGELIGAGEVWLQPHEAYTAPTVYAAFAGDGLNTASNAFHQHLRDRPHHPRLPRPIHLNTWEAVYFDQNLDTLRSLADVAASVGVERFVLDDGWFGERRDDRRGLGDWTVSADVWPEGLTPLIDHVRQHGMEFGLWVEPEMINPDSDLYRAHPEWTLVDHRYPMVLGRHQLMLDVGRADVRDYLFERLDALLAEYDIAYLKWDHNRDIVGGDRDGRSAVHRQTLGLYELLDRVRAAHPRVEIETCASGGGRVDFGILDRTDRVWTSDSLDALDRISIQRGFSLFVPPELMGSHIGAPVTHSTGRQHRLRFRVISAIFGAFGIEWNLLEASDDDRATIAKAIEFHKRWRDVLHTGRVVRLDHPDPTVAVHGVVAAGRESALFAVARTANSANHHTSPLKFVGLDADTTYRVRLVDELSDRLGGARRQPAWTTQGLTASGQHLAKVGVQSPQLEAESAILLEITT